MSPLRGRFIVAHRFKFAVVTGFLVSSD